MKTKYRILVVDDEEAILFSFEKLLRTPIVEVDVCMDLEKALALLASENYDAVITDYRLSHSESREGLEILQYIKDHNLAAAVIFLTGYGSDEIKAKALALGAAGYFDKPIRASQLYGILNKWGIPVGNA